MSGIGLLLNIAKDALLSQQLAMDIVGQNIANVNTPGYSRQTANLQTRAPAPYAGFLLGRGVEVQEIIRNVDPFVETRLQQRKTALNSLQEKEVYMGVLEGVFSESSERSLGTLLADFWNAWHDLSNNPTGSSERTVVCERAVLLCEAFNGVHADLGRLTTELNLSLEAGVEKVNELVAQIAQLNRQIVAERVHGSPNDLLDQRNRLVTELSELMDIRYYENDDGNLTVTTGRGYILVSKADSYELSYDDGRIRWETSGGARTDITDTITGGKMGGWLDMRDAIIPKYESDLNELAKTIIWEVNRIYSQGVGLVGFSELTGSYAVTDPSAPLDSSGLDFADRIQTGSFRFWVYDANGDVVDLGGPGGSLQISVDPASTTLEDIRDAINGLAGGNITASITADGRLSIQGGAGHTFAFSEDTSGVLAGLGINTFFEGSSPVEQDYARFITLNSTLITNKDYVAAARVDGDTGEFAEGDNSNALAVSGLESQNVTSHRYYYERGQDNPVTETATDTIGGHLASFIGSIGVFSQSVTRSREYTEIITNQLRETRDNISAVSIDEEMADLIKFQHAYAAAAKLIATADEMFQTLLDVK